MFCQHQDVQFLRHPGLVGGWLLQIGAGWRKAINRSLYSSSSPAHLPSCAGWPTIQGQIFKILNLGSKIQDLRFKIEDLRSPTHLPSSGWADPRWMRIWGSEVSPALQKYSAHKRPPPSISRAEGGGREGRTKVIVTISTATSPRGGRGLYNNHHTSRQVASSGIVINSSIQPLAHRFASQSPGRALNSAAGE